MKIFHRNYRVVRYVIYRQTIVNPQDHLWTFIGAFLGIGIIGFIHEMFTPFSVNEKVFLIGSFGASAVLVYGATNSPLAQPRNLLGGHLISAFVGVSIYKLLSGFDMLWLNAALAVSISIVAMQCTKTMHPPGGATALIANMGTPKIIGLGYWYVVYPVFSGIAILLAVALITNNIPQGRSYPTKQLFRIHPKLIFVRKNRDTNLLRWEMFRRIVKRIVRTIRQR